MGYLRYLHQAFGNRCECETDHRLKYFQPQYLTAKIIIGYNTAGFNVFS